jgi:multidrug efflux pump subunit AcrB
MFSHFFIERPIFASVMSIVITLAGAVAAFNLPVAQYPQITPPSIIVSCTYPGANAHVVADSVAAPIEQQVNGVEDMLYMVSQSNNDGSYTLTVTFKPGVHINFAQVLVQNRVNLAMPLLPDVVKQTGVTTRKRNPDILQVVAIYSPKGRYDQLYLSNFASIRIADELKRVHGVGDVNIFGQQDYSMRLWVDPEKLASLNMTAGDVANAIREQNRQVAAGHIGQEPTASGKPFEFTITTLGRLSDPAEFEDIVLRTDGEGRKVRLKDVGHAELGAKNMDSTSKLNGRPNGSLAVFALPEANSIDVANRVIAKMEELKKSFPEDIDYAVSLDMTPFIRESIKEVVRTLIEAIVLVAVVVLVFLQNWRSALIPLVAVPVAVVGTFAVMAVIGFSLNNLTLFGLGLAIGIVVDDAIVVVEAIEHHIEHGLSPRRAAHKAMEQVSGPVIAVALVLSAVFVPCAFISGITGQFFRQFALTIAVSTVISAFNSLTLSPALAAILLQPRGAKKDLPGRILDLVLGWFFRLFNATFRRATGAYTGVVGLALRGCAVVLVLYVGMLGLTGAGFIGIPGLNRLPKDHLPALLTDKWGSFDPANGLPSGYIPNQDQGRFYIAVQLPDAASLQRTQKVVDRIQRLVQPLGGIVHVTEIAGQSFTLNANGSNFGQFFVSFEGFDRRAELEKETWLKFTPASLTALREAGVPVSVLSKLTPLRLLDLREEELRTELGKLLDEEEREEFEDLLVEHGERVHLGMSATAITDRVRELLARELPEAMVSIFTPPPVSGLGSASGFKIIIEDRGDLGLAEIQKQVERIMAAGNAGHFKLTEKSIASLHGGEKPLPETVLTQLEHLKDKDYLTRELFEKAVRDSLKTAGFPKPAEQEAMLNRVTGAAENHKVVGNLFSVFRANTPQLFMDIERDKCQAMGVNPVDVFSTLQIYLGSLYVNDFNRFGRTWQVIVQSGGDYRDDLDKIKLLQVRNATGEMVPLGAVVKVREIGGPINIGRYNMYPAAAILGSTQPGVSSGEGIEEMERLCHELLPPGMAFEWSEINYMQIDAAKNIWNNLIFLLAVAFVFLVLAAQYESWALPLAVILVVPMCILGSLTGVAVTGGDINIFTQIGFVVLVGLASKNAILIVEFAKHTHEEGGLSRREATLAACRLRLRPILMTSFAFILGVVPLLVGHGAGSEMRRTLGVAVFSGMVGVTLFGIFLTPVFFYVIEGFAETPLLAAARTRRVGKVLLYIVGVLTLGIPRLLVLLFSMARRRGPIRTRRPTVRVEVGTASNGHAATPHVNGVTTNGHDKTQDGETAGSEADSRFLLRKLGAPPHTQAQLENAGQDTRIPFPRKEVGCEAELREGRSQAELGNGGNEDVESKASTESP